MKFLIELKINEYYSGFSVLAERPELDPQGINPPIYKN